MTPIERLLQTAENEVGYLEKASNFDLDSKTGNAGYNNWTKYARDFDQIFPDFYNGRKNGYAWCDMFVDWCFINTFGRELGQKLLCQPDRSCGAGCRESARYYSYKGQLYYSNPLPGDQIFFGTNGDYYHTGIVYDVDDRYIYTIEGNTSSAAGVEPNGGGVFKKRYGKYGNMAFGRPDYSLVSRDFKPEEIIKPEPPKPEVQVKYDITLQEVYFRDYTRLVKCLQSLLIAHGYPCGPSGIDGDFGSGTLRALNNFQRAHKLPVTKKCDQKDWQKLLEG